MKISSVFCVNFMNFLIFKEHTLCVSVTPCIKGDKSTQILFIRKKRYFLYFLQVSSLSGPVHIVIFFRLMVTL
jgi:hypothetical protein